MSGEREEEAGVAGRPVIAGSRAPQAPHRDVHAQQLSQELRVGGELAAECGERLVARREDGERRLRALDEGGEASCVQELGERADAVGVGPVREGPRGGWRGRVVGRTVGRTHRGGGGIRGREVSLGYEVGH